MTDGGLCGDRSIGALVAVACVAGPSAYPSWRNEPGSPASSRAPPDAAACGDEDVLVAFASFPNAMSGWELIEEYGIAKLEHDTTFRTDDSNGCGLIRPYKLDVSGSAAQHVAGLPGRRPWGAA